MNLIQFIIALFFLSVSLLVKLFFYSVENEYKLTVIGNLDIILFSFIFIGMIFYYLKNDLKSHKIRLKEDRLDNGTIAILAIIILVVGFSLFITTGKKSLDWDATALYHARAIFLENGISFSDMRNLSEFDTKNAYYYLLYPPFTSVIHYFWIVSGISSPVSMLYSILLLIIGVVTFASFNKRLPLFLSLAGVLLVVANRDIFYTSVIEYTNIFFSLFIMFGIFLLYEYIEFRSKWKLLAAALLISTSQWIRFLEPVWFAIALSWLIVLVRTKSFRKNLMGFALFVVICLIQYLSWSYFTEIVAHNPQAINLNFIPLLDAALGVFTGSLWNMLKVVINSWGILLVSYLIAVVPAKSIRSNGIQFLSYVIMLSIGLYLGGMYLISTSYDWWPELTDSLTRSSTFLVPISIFLILMKVGHKEKKNVTK